MSYLLGQNLIIANESGNALIAAAKSCAIRKEREMIETSSPTSGTYRTYRGGRIGWSISLSNLTVSPGTDLDKVGGSPVTIRVTVNGTTVNTGMAIFAVCEITATIGNLAKGTFELQGTGPLSNPES